MSNTSDFIKLLNDEMEQLVAYKDINNQHCIDGVSFNEEQSNVLRKVFNIHEEEIAELSTKIIKQNQQIAELEKKIDFISRENNSYKYNQDEHHRIIEDFAHQLKSLPKQICDEIIERFEKENDYSLCMYFDKIIREIKKKYEEKCNADK